MIKHLFKVLLFCCGLSAVAQNETSENISKADSSDYFSPEAMDSLDFEDYKNLEEVVITPEYYKESQVLVPTSKVKDETIDNYSPADLISAINQTPGVYIQSGALNTNRIVIRGVGARTLYGTNKLKAYFNGIPITSGVGETAIDTYNPQDLEQIEIVKGPKATLYGSNLGGALLLRSKKPEVGNTEVNNSTTVGSFGMVKTATSVNHAEKRYSIHFNYDYLGMEGYRDNSQYKRNTFFLTGSYYLDEANELTLLFNQRNFNAEIPSSIGQTAYETDPTQAAYTWGQAEGYEDDKTTLAGLSLKHAFSEKLSNTTSIFYTYTNHYEPRPFNILDENTNGYGLRTVFDGSSRLATKKLKWNIGTEYYRDNYQWKTIENLYEQNPDNGSVEGNQLSQNKEIRNKINVFAQAVWFLTENLEVQFGLNFNKTSYDYTDQFNTGAGNTSANRDFDPVLAPSLSASYKLTETKLLYANVSRGFNYPGLEETLTPEGVINPEIGPEKGWNYEIGADMHFMDKKLHIDLTAYTLEITGLLVAERVGQDQYIGRNAGKTSHKGFELASDYTIQPNEDFRIIPFLNASFNFYKFTDFVDAENNYSGNALTGVPEKKINAGINVMQRKFQINLNYQHVGAIPMNDANALYSDPYNVFNLKTTYHIISGTFIKAQIYAGVNNFTDEKYASSILINAVGFGDSEPRYYYPGLPRNYYGGFLVKLSF